MCRPSWFLVILDIGCKLSRVLQRTPLDCTSPLLDTVTYPFVTYSIQNMLDRVSLCSFGACPGMGSVDQAGLELTEICLPLPPEC
ncbi:hypothetical protein STEG23_009295 [Scotinomys teguina]